MQGWSELAAAAGSINVACVRWDERERDRVAGSEGAREGREKERREDAFLAFSLTRTICAALLVVVFALIKKHQFWLFL
jgi:hypothetical protein